MKNHTSQVVKPGVCTWSVCFSFCPFALLHLSTTVLDEEAGTWAQLSRGFACDAGLFFTDCHGDTGDLHSEQIKSLS